jgi:nucleoside-diphosphate-sugar epimerase
MVGGLIDRQVLVTGASGFIGGRLVERLLLEEGAHVKALIRSYTTAQWLSRTMAQVCLGDVTQPQSLEPALEGCDVVFHCAAMLGGDPQQMERVNATGTKNLLQAARRAGVSRFVHVSSLAVHGQDYADGADEMAPFAPGNDPYARTKLAGEQLARQSYEQHRLPVVILRPTIVYGPRSQFWTIDPLERIKRDRLALLGQGDGVANVVYVDDVVTALLLAAAAPGVEGEAFLISGMERVTWREFFGAYAAMAQREISTWSGPKARLIAASTDLLDRAIDRLRGTEKTIGGLHLMLVIGLLGSRKLAGGLYKLRRWEIPMYRQKAQINVSKAGRLLGYGSAWPLSRAMAEVERWLRMQAYLRTEVDG